MTTYKDLIRFEEQIYFDLIYACKSGLNCWLWTGYKDQDGYGKFRVERHSTQAHRWSYENMLYPRRIPEEMVLDHLCRNRSCVNPAHLEPVTHNENINRGLLGNMTHCKRGHEFTIENTYKQPYGRGCRTCKKERDHKSYINRKGR